MGSDPLWGQTPFKKNKNLLRMRRFTRRVAIQKNPKFGKAKFNLVHIIRIRATMIITVSTNITFRHPRNKQLNGPRLLQTNKIANQMQPRKQNQKIKKLSSYHKSQ